MQSVTWVRDTANAAANADSSAPPVSTSALYQRLLTPQRPGRAVLAQAEEFLRGRLQATAALDQPDPLPGQPDDLLGWMQSHARSVTARYALYLERRRAGGPREYFSSRAHALYFLRGVAPTKLVDGAWLHGLLGQAQDARLHGLIRTYLEELGDGDAVQNHVLLYRRLLAAHGLDADLQEPGVLPGAHYEQGAIQLALGWLGASGDWLPEVVGFNLGYEQLPLHLLITAYELDELGIDPYYFTVHVTVDNLASGHARRACQAVRSLMPQGDAQEARTWWRGARRGALLAELGLGTHDVITGFDIEAEVLRILAAKAPAGSGAHSDHCRIGGKHVNQWLADPSRLPDFVQALEQGGWIVHGQEPSQSRFWRMLHGGHASMFGVFTHYELQVLHDWLRGPQAAMDGRGYDASDAMAAIGACGAPRRPMSFRAQARLREVRNGVVGPQINAPARASAFERPKPLHLLAPLLAPALHWQPAGLQATREFARALVL